jgi:hypothetical protein
MTQPRDPSRSHRVTLGTRSVKARSRPRPEQQASSTQGPFDLSGYLAVFQDPISPGSFGQDVEVAIFFPDPDAQLARSVTAFVTEVSPPSTPVQSDAIFLTNQVQFDHHNQIVEVGYAVAWDSPLHVAVMLTVSSTGPIGNSSGPIFGPFNVADYIFCSTQPDEWAQPGLNTLTIDLRPLGIKPWTISASVTELSPPSTPWQGGANFRTLGAQLNQPDQVATVFCDSDWGAPLPVAVMMTIGYTLEP